MIDTHCHIQEKEFDLDRHDVVARALEAGVGRMVCIGSNRENSIRAVELAKQHPESLVATFGIHPLDEESDLTQEDLGSWLNEMHTSSKGKAVAIGECGLDSSRCETEIERDKTIERQTVLFRAQLDFAYAHQMPVIFHVNKEYEEVVGILEEYKKRGVTFRGVFHFYTGGKKRIQRLIELGDFYFGVGGAMTYDEGLQQVAAQIPLARILLETDAPYVAPIPHRGERSEPAYVAHVAEKLAQLKGVTIDEVINQTDQNAYTLFAFSQIN